MSYLGNSPGVSSQRTTSSYTATSNQTTFTAIGGYQLGYVDVYLNGTKLIANTDYTASNGTSVVLVTGANTGDSVDLVSYQPRGLSDGYLKAEADAKYELLASKGTANGYASLDGSAKVPSSQLPSYVDDVLEAANFAALPATGTTGIIYITLDTNYTYRWTGSTYVQVGGGSAGGSSGQVQYNNAGAFAGSANFVFDGTNVGIGTSSPSSFYAGARKLVVGGASGEQGLTIYSGDNFGYLLFATGTSGTNPYSGQVRYDQPTLSMQVVNFQNGPLQFLTNNTERMRITSAGNVGIGTSAPAKPFNLVTSGTTEAWFESTSTQKAILSLYAGDNAVGITSTYNSGGTAARPFIFNNVSTSLLQFDLGKTVALQGATTKTGTGITFPATQSASSDANTLDDYEEGTWTPTCSNGSTYSGTYTKIGRIVHLFFETSSSGTITANSTTLSGLPFTPSGSGNSSGSGTYVNVTSTAAFGGLQITTSSLYFVTSTSSAALRGYHCYYV